MARVRLGRSISEFEPKQRILPANNIRSVDRREDSAADRRCSGEGYYYLATGWGSLQIARWLMAPKLRQLQARR